MRAHYGAESKVNDGGFARSTQGFGNRIHTLKHEFAHGFRHGCEHEFKRRHCRKTSRSFVRLAHVCKRRIPTVVAVVLCWRYGRPWVPHRQCASTMIAAPSEIAQATVETGRRYGRPRKSLCLKVPSDSCSPYCSAFSSAYCCTAHALRTPHCSRCFQLRRPCR